MYFQFFVAFCILQDQVCLLARIANCLGMSRPKKSGGGLALSRWAEHSSTQASETPKSTLSKNRSSATTFGIEFEFVFAFHEDELRRALAQMNAKAVIQKDLTRTEHEQLLGKQWNMFNYRLQRPWENREHWPSWCLLVENDDSTVYSAGIGLRSLPYSYLWLRHYILEPLIVAQNALKTANCPTTVIGLTEPPSPRSSSLDHGGHILFKKQDTNYEIWILTNDISLIGATKGELFKNLQDRITPEDRIDNKWDSWGVELITRKFRYSEAKGAFQEIGKYLSALKHGSHSLLETGSPVQQRWGALSSVWAGAHVHIGFDGKEEDDLDLTLLQHIAYILIMYEGVLTKLHPRHRSGREPTSGTSSEFLPGPSPAADETPSQREERISAALDNAHTGHPEVQSNADFFLKRLAGDGAGPETVGWAKMRDEIFRSSTPAILIQAIQDFDYRSGRPKRGYMVNWSNIYHFSTQSEWGREPERPIKPTLEFRQHACSLDTDEMLHWVDLLFAIIGAAERKKTQAQRWDGKELTKIRYATDEGSKYEISETWRPSTVEDLCGPNLLNLNEAEISYWQQRYDKYQGSDNGKATKSGEVRKGSPEKSAHGKIQVGTDTLDLLDRGNATATAERFRRQGVLREMIHARPNLVTQHEIVEHLDATGYDVDAAYVRWQAHHIWATQEAERINQERRKAVEPAGLEDEDEEEGEAEEEEVKQTVKKRSRPEKGEEEDLEGKRTTQKRSKRS